ncbi:AAA family ATPase [Phocaeicola plebeius]
MREVSFFSHLRRLGIGSLISAQEAYYSGRKELFQELFIYEVKRYWSSYPILHFDLNTQKYDSLDNLNDILSTILVK